ncbi:MAG: nucleotide exchange factor GrpE [Clostridiales bacterium]|nr:MAG: nucleotide exchange factor GrpE [Clostridiales bacterium]
MAEEKKKKKQEQAAAGETADNMPQQEKTEEIGALVDELTKANDALAKELENAKKLAEETKDTLLRTAAEYDNYRKRSAREKDAVYAETVAATIGAFLPVIDNLERAVAFSDTDGLKEGLELTMKQLSEVLSKLKITAVDPAGQPFDPNLHNAVMHVEDESVGDNTVVDVLQKGYMIDGRVIRHAMVRVAN